MVSFLKLGHDELNHGIDVFRIGWIQRVVGSNVTIPLRILLE